MNHRRVVLAAFLVSQCGILTVISLGSEADTRLSGPPATVRGTLHSSGFRVSASTPDGVRFTLSVPALHVRPLRGREYRLTLEDGEPLAIDGAPDLPVYRRLVAVADGGAVSVAVRVDRTTTIDGVQLRSYRNPPGHDVGPSSPFGSPAAVRLSGVFPETNASVEYVGHLRGQRIASVLVSPVRWDRASRRIIVATDMDIRVTVHQPQGSVLHDVGPMDAALTEAVLNWPSRGTSGVIFAGPSSSSVTMSAGGQVCWCTGSTWQAAAAAAASCGADYLMIVTDSLASSSLIDSLALRRASYDGFNVAIATVSQMRTTEMSTEPDTLVTPVMIRSMIDSVYASQTAAHMSDGRLGYVLLVGDAFDSDRKVLVPSYYGYGSGFSQQAASDAYYSFLDDPATDRLPDVLIGRLPVDDDSANWELTNVVTKILAYETLPTAAWVDSVLMVSGVSDDGFTFDGQGLSGFQAFFDSVLAHHSPPGKSVIELHRLTLPSNEGNHGTFGETVAGAVEAGKWLTAFFDHGFLYYWDGAFYPRNYEFLNNEGQPTIVLSLGSQTCQFDNTHETAQAWYSACCTWPPPPEPPFSIGCESPGYEYIDPCDAMGERMLVQPAGAIAVIGYSRTTGWWNAQQDFVSLFRSLSQQNPNTLGEFLVGARLFRVSDLVTVRNLMLLGDPALNIRTRAPAPADTFDVAVGTSDIRTTWGSYAHSVGTIEVTVHNAWKTDVPDLEVELWRGEPGSGGSSLLGTEVIDTLRAYGPDVVTFSVSGLEGNVRLYVVLDPDDLIAERAEDNNIAFRDFLALLYEGSYPTRLPFTGARRSVAIADLASAAGKEFLVAGGTGTDNLVQCYAVGDTQSVWTYATGSLTSFIKSHPAVGHIYKSATPYVALEWGNPSSVRIVNGQSGSVVKTRLVGDTRSQVSGWDAKWILSDLGPDDTEMELLTLRYVDGTLIDSLQVRAFAPNDTILFTRAIDVGNTVAAATMAIGDLDRDGSKEIVVLQALANTGLDSPAAGKELTVFSYGAGGLVRMWQADLANGGTISNPAIVLIDTDGDGDLSILCNGAYPGPILRLYSAGGTAAWTLSDLTLSYPVHFSAGDIDADGAAEVVVLDHQRVRLLSSSAGSVLDTRTMPGDPVTPPLLIDLDANGSLEIVVVYEEQDPNIHFYPPNQAPFWTHVVILDANLDLVQPEWTFRTRQSASSSCLPAIDDIDSDGKYEMVYVSPDQYLHVFELGAAVGEAAWSQRFGNALNTGLDEQPILGDGYVNPVSLYQKTRMLGHVVLDSTAAPSLYIGHGTEIRVDASVSDLFQLRAFGSVRMKGSATAPVVIHSNPPASGAAAWGGLYVHDRFASAADPDTLACVELSDASTGIEVHSPLHVTASAVWNVFNAGIVTDDTLSVTASDVVASSEVGIELLAGGHGWISDSHVEGAGIGLLVAQGSPLTVRNSTISNVGAAGVVAGGTLWFDRSAVSASSGLGIKLASGAVGRIRKSVVSNTDSTAVLCDSCSSESTIDSTTVRVAGGTGVRIIGDGTWPDSSGLAIDSCTVESNAGAGVRFENAHGHVLRSRVLGNGAGIAIVDGSGESSVENSVITGGAVGVQHDAPVRMVGTTISNVQDAAVISTDSLWLDQSTLNGSLGIGIKLASGAVGRIKRSWVLNTDSTAVLCDSCSYSTTIDSTTVSSSGGDGIHVIGNGSWQGTGGIAVDSCTVASSAGAGVRFDGAHGTILRSRLEGNGMGVVTAAGGDLTAIQNSIITGGSAGVEHGSPVRITGTTISSVQDVGVASGDTLWIEASEVTASGGIGVRLGPGAVGRLDDILVQYTDSTAVLCDTCAAGTVINRTNVQSAGLHGIHAIGTTGWAGTAGITIDSCTVDGSPASGIRFDLAHGTISYCSIDGGLEGVFVGSGGASGSLVHSSISNCDVGVENSSPLTVTNVDIDNAAVTAIVAYDTLLVDECQIGGSPGVGIHLRAGALGVISDVGITGSDFSAIVCDTCGTGSTLTRASIDAAGLYGIHAVAVWDMTIDSCVVTNSASTAIRFEEGNGVIRRSRLDSNGGGVACFDGSHPVIRECSMDGNGGGVSAADNSFPVVGDVGVGGLNCITNTTGYNVTNLSDPDTPVNARFCHWGAICCKPSKFYGNVVCDSCETASACDAAAAPASAVVVLKQGEAEAGPKGAAEAELDSLVVQNEEVPVLPEKLDLVGAAPNPFNPSVRIRYAVPAGGADVQLTVYNVRGQRVAVLHDGPTPPGYHEAIWHGVTSRGAAAASGVYFVRMSAGKFRKTMRLVLLK